MTNKMMDEGVAELRQAIEVAKRGKRNGPVPPDLRKRAVEVLRAQRAIGKTAEQAATSVGVHTTTLLTWEKQFRSAFRPAQVVAERDAVARPPVTPVGRTYRLTVIDGLDASALAAVLREMA